MFNVCPGCGAYSEEKEIDPAGPFAICLACGYGHSFIRSPLYIITGASGAGKTTLCLDLAVRSTDYVFMEMDILWRPEFNKPENDFADFRNVWLRVAKNINQAGRPTVLCGSATPGQFEACSEARYFDGLHYLALVCEPETLRARLEARPDWRQASSAPFIEGMLAYNQWFCDHDGQFVPPLSALDTTSLSLEETAAQVIDWLTQRQT
jgi:hypothetical protein